MEIWFWFALVGAVLAGVSNFYFKQAAMRGYSAELFSLYGGLASVAAVGIAVLVKQVPLTGYGYLVPLVFAGGLLASGTGIMKVLVLRNIDSTIYFPLFKLLAPAAAIGFGIVYFQESFTRAEWIGMILGLIVPLLLITKTEFSRQNNLPLGLFFVLVTGILSATIAAFNKAAIDLQMPVLATLLFASVGVLIGTVFIIAYRNGYLKLLYFITHHTNRGVVVGGTLRAMLISVSLGFTMYAYANGGSLAVVQTIHSMYILIPIVLAIFLYNEHWNLQKP